MRKKYSGFTLVELIVVVVILWVLASIGFVSYNGYLWWARDGNRVTQLKNINDSLSLYSSNNPLPLPDDSIDIVSGTDTVWYQWYAGINILELINYTSGGQDPRDNVFYTYYVSADRQDFQLLGFLEETDNLQASIPGVAQVHAVDYTFRNPKVYGKKLGVLTSNVSTTLNTPAQEVTTSDIDLVTSTLYSAHLTDFDTVTSSSPWDLLAVLPNANCNRIKQLGNARWSGNYEINPTGIAEIDVYCDMETEGGWWTLGGRSTPSGGASTYLTADSGSVEDFTQNYSLNVWSISFTERMIASYSAGTNIIESEVQEWTTTSATVWDYTLAASGITGGASGDGLNGEQGMVFVR